MNVTDDSVAISDLVTTVKNVITAANISRTNEDRDLKITSVRLGLNAIATHSAGGGLDFRLPIIGMKLKVGATLTRHDTHSIEMTLMPADQAPRHEIRDEGIEIVLLEAIDSIRAVMSLAVGGDDPFLLATSAVDISFAIAKDGSITLGASGEFNGEVTHRLRIELEPN